MIIAYDMATFSDPEWDWRMAAAVLVERKVTSRASDIVPEVELALDLRLALLIGSHHFSGSRQTVYLFYQAVAGREWQRI